MNQIAPTPTVQFVLNVVKGPHKGEKYKLMASEIYIGRDSTNHICLDKDKKVSRKHCLIRFTQQGPIIQQLADNNKMFVNGKNVKKAPLGARTKFTVGETTFIFETAQSNHLAVVNPNAQVPGGAYAPATGRKRKKKKDGLNFIHLLILAIVVVAGWLSTQKGKKDSKSPLPGLDDDTKIEEVIEQTKKLKEEKTKMLHLEVKNSPQYQQAHVAYKLGKRDFDVGNYTRALSAFQTCLSLYPEHQLCQRYEALAWRKHDELINHYNTLGLKYRDQNQYKNCEHSFSQVLRLLQGQRSDKRYNIALENRKFCALAQGDLVK